MTLSDQLRGAVFKGLEPYDLGDVLYSFSEMLRISGGSNDGAKFLRAIVKCFVRSERFIFVQNDAPILLAFVSASANQRADIRQIRKNILGLGVPMQTLDAQSGFFPSFGDSISAISHLLSWSRTLKGAGIPRKWLVPVLDRLLSLWRFDRFCSRNIPFEQLRLATVFYDSEPRHHLFVRKCQQKGIATATLQHGLILAPRKGLTDNVDFAGLEFLGSCADTFLAWNRFTVAEGIKAGLGEHRFAIVGSSRTIGTRTSGDQVLGRGNGRFGVLLDGAFTAENNPRLISIATEFAERQRSTFEVRYHPRFHGDEYGDILPYGAFQPERRYETVHDFCARMDFVLAASSTAVMEALDFGVSVYLLHSGNDTEKFRDVSVPQVSSAVELENCIRLDQDGSIQNILRRQLLFEGDSAGAYRDFFCSFIPERPHQTDAQDNL